MKYETTQVMLMALCPTIFPDEAHVLRHLFFVNGNGMQWVNGQMVDIAIDLGLHNFAAAVTENNRQQIESYRKKLDDYRDYQKMCLVFDSVPESEEDFIGQPHVVNNKGIYPLSDSCMIMQVPDDIQDDWLDAAFRALEVAKTLKKSKSDRAYLSKAKNRLKIIYTLRALPQLNHRYPKGSDMDYVMTNFELCLALLERHERETAVSKKVKNENS